MGARYYDPIVGRFMVMDPVCVNPEDPRTYNRFAYAANNPYKYVDTDGRAFMFVPLVIPFWMVQQFLVMLLEMKMLVIMSLGLVKLIQIKKGKL